MINLDILIKQHRTVSAEITAILTEAEKEEASLDTAAAAYHISILAGQLRMHLLQEDKFLYPDLLESKDFKLQELAKSYITEMGNLAELYTKYKNNYNTGKKINDNIKTFRKDTLLIMKVLQNRIEKENDELYCMIQGL
jgi:hypothetical protein